LASTFDCWPDAADVHAVDDHARHRLQHHPWIARRGQPLQLIVGDAGGDGLACGIHHRRLGHHLHGLGDAADAQGNRQRHADAGRDFDGVGAEGAEPAQVGGDRVPARREVQEVRLAFVVGGLRLRGGAADFDQHAGDRPALRIDDGDVDAALKEGLRERRWGERE
jgi:hypothetical protein